MIVTFVWCYDVGEAVHRHLEPIRILKTGGMTRASSITV